MGAKTDNIVSCLRVAMVLGCLCGSAHASAFGKKRAGEVLVTPQALTAQQNALLDQAIQREKNITKTLRERAPVVETYLQNMRPDPVSVQVPESDQRFLGRVEFRNVIGDASFQADRHAPYDGGKGRFGMLRPSSFLGNMTNGLHLQFHEAGFVQMLLMDSNGFDRQHYKFGYVRSEFLGSIPTQVFDVAPIPQKGGMDAMWMKSTTGRFLGRIWVETRSGSVVRFNGEFAGTVKGVREFYHFDSWRTNVESNLWLPTSIYIEESESRSSVKTLKFKAVSRIWGYSLKVPQADEESTSMEVVGATDMSEDAPDVSPLGAQRAWVQESEDNVVERMFTAGMLAAPSPFEKTMEALVANILAYNNVSVPRPIHVRTLLTDSLESMAVGNTIIVSKALVDTSAVTSESGDQQAGNLNAILAFQLAHILLGHRLDTKFAFNDNLLFRQTAVMRRIPMHHSDADNTAAAKKAMELLAAPELAGGQPYFGLYLQQLRQREKALTALSRPLLGDGLEKSENDHAFWMEAMLSKAPKLEVADVTQQAAMPLASFLKVDPETDQVVQLRAAAEPLVTAADKLPFEIAPVYLRLRYRETPPVPVNPGTPAPPDRQQPPVAAPSDQPGRPPATPPTSTAAPLPNGSAEQ